jgi:AraC-like DNA-binding protein
VASHNVASDFEPGSGASRTLRELVSLLERHAPRDGVCPTAAPGVAVIRMSHPSDEMDHGTQDPAVCIVAQGSKELMLRDERLVYDAAHFLVFSVELPVVARILEATPQLPYLCMRLSLQPPDIAALLAQRGDLPAPARASSRGLYVSRSSEALLDAAVRLLRLLEAPDDMAVLGPLAQQEILYRVLKSDQGERLAQVARADSHASRIARAIAWLKAHFTEPLRIETLAEQAHMSVSSLHHHFRAITSMSPLQYQKQLRLLEARRLLISTAGDAASTGYQVGYESPSQFSREYARMFGTPPARDAQRWRGEALRQAAV